MSKTRVFFVVDSYESNEEIFPTLEGAQAYLAHTIGTEPGARLYIAIVKNAYFDEQAGGWNYDDQSDTFKIIDIVEAKNEQAK